MKLKIWMFGLGICLATSAVYASKTDTVVKAEDKDDFTTAVTAVHQLMAPGGRYEFVTAEERSTIDSRFGDMQSLFDKFGTTAQMDSDSKVKLLNDQEEINAILTKRDSKRVVCERAAPTGSLLPKSTCRTYGEIEKNHRDSQKFLDDNATHSVNNHSGG